MPRENEKGRMHPNKKSPGPTLIRGLREIRETLEEGVELEERFTVKTVQLDLEPQEFGPNDVVSLRARFNASQGVFAKMLGVTIHTVQSWEQGRIEPSLLARRLLETIEKNPEPWKQMLRHAAHAS